MATIIRTDGSQQEVSIPEGDSLSFLQGVVGGYIEWVWLADGRGMYINEEGKLDDLPVNQMATELFHSGRITSDYIVGDVIVLTREETRKEVEG